MNLRYCTRCARDVLFPDLPEEHAFPDLCPSCQNNLERQAYILAPRRGLAIWTTHWPDAFKRIFRDEKEAGLVVVCDASMDIPWWLDSRFPLDFLKADTLRVYELRNGCTIGHAVWNEEGL